MTKRTHGSPPEYKNWFLMHSRCNKQHHKSYKDYGARGIKVCERWNKYENFIADMGPRPSKFHSIDRINNDGDYEPSNCRWATKSQQGLNRRTSTKITYKNKTQTLTEWAQETGIDFKVLWWRLNVGKWSVAKALSMIEVDE